MFGPEAAYERSGDVKDVVFPCGQTAGLGGDTIYLQYGAGDSCLALATGSIRSLLSWLESNSGPREEITQERDLANGREEPLR
jgi:beta-1,2-mannobiose phosphorylase / 1,2-beta-oligomannan phosphorylase